MHQLPFLPELQDRQLPVPCTSYRRRHHDLHRKVRLDFKTGDLLSGAVYPSWHPQQNLIAYSVNTTEQLFYSHGLQKTEVYDGASDLVLYDAETNDVSYIVHDSLSMETFPYWAADGKTLYFVQATAIPEGSK